LYKVLNFIFECAEKYPQISSISLPALGTGGWGYPVEEFLAIFYQVI
jgi:O-acetyl-ADP-ribose deacetylase (regulator of RNase III)